MHRSTAAIQSVFSKWLGIKARGLAAEGKIAIIEMADFPQGAPIHEDDSETYDPRKPLVLFAVNCRTAAEVQAWKAVCREYDELRAQVSA